MPDPAPVRAGTRRGVLSDPRVRVFLRRVLLTDLASFAVWLGVVLLFPATISVATAVVAMTFVLAVGAAGVAAVCQGPMSPWIESLSLVGWATCGYCAPPQK
jgi:hypothetical protein